MLKELQLAQHNTAKRNDEQYTVEVTSQCPKPHSDNIQFTSLDAGFVSQLVSLPFCSDQEPLEAEEMFKRLNHPLYQRYLTEDQGLQA